MNKVKVGDYVTIKTTQEFVLFVEEVNEDGTGIIGGTIEGYYEFPLHNVVPDED